MNRNRIAAILVACALLLAVGAYFLVSNQPVNQHTLRKEVVPPDETATPPAWVGKKQETKPDYSSAEAEATDATPVEKEAGKTKVIEVKEDKIITFSFVDGLVDYMLNGFIPKDKYGRPATKTSAKSLNVHFGQEMTGFRVKGDDINSARKSVLDYAFTPKAIEVLYALYAPLFVEQLVETASNDAREYTQGDANDTRTLEDAEIAAMLRLNAVRISQTAMVFKTIATDKTIAEMGGQYIQAAKNVDRANEQLQNAIADGQKTTDAGQRLKQAIMQREQIKTAIINKMQETCTGCSPKELFYLSKWSYRRALGDEEKLAAFDSAATVLDDLAKRFLNKAAELDK